MELSAAVRLEKSERLKARKEAIKQNKLSKEQLDEIVKEEAIHISTRDASCDVHAVKKWTPKLNDEFRALPRLIGDRDPTNERLSALRMKIAACRLPFHWDIAYCESENTVYRLNGNTTSLLAAAHPELFEEATIYWTEYMCSTAEEYNLIYSQFDPRTSMRTKANALLPYIVTYGIGIQPTVVPQVLSAIVLVHDLVHKKNSRTIEEHAALLHSQLPFVYWLEENIYSIKDSYTRPFLRVCAVAAIYVTWLSDYRDRAVEFWNRVIYTGDHNYSPGDPCLTLNHLISTTAAPRSDGDNREVLEQFAWCMMAWNAFIANRAVASIRAVGGRPLPPVAGINKIRAKEFRLLGQKIPEKRPAKQLQPVAEKEKKVAKA